MTNSNTPNTTADFAAQNPNKLFPLFLADTLDALKPFYVEKLGFHVSIETENYLQFQHGQGGPELCFMKRDAFPDGVTRPAFGGEGVMVSVPVDNADQKHSDISKAGAHPMTPPGDKPWGWRSFLVEDPCGVVIDFFHVSPDAAAM